jgi:DNA-binding NarL/FixJ family response regulator
MESYEINSTFYAMRLLSHGLDISQIEAVEGDEYPATEFSREEQTRGLEILHNIEASETVSLRELGPETIQTYVIHLADQIEGFATSDLVEAGYDIGKTGISAQLPKSAIAKETTGLSSRVKKSPRWRDEMRHARIILADDDTFLLEALKGLLQDEFEVVGTFADGHALVQAAPALSPDVIVMDVGMPGMNWLIAGRHLKKALPSVKLIYLTMKEDRALAGEALRLGASGYLGKDSAASELVYAIREALLGRSHVTQLMTTRMTDSFVKNLRHKETPQSLTVRQIVDSDAANIGTLTAQEHEVIRLVSEGLKNKAIGKKLTISQTAVRHHLTSIFEKLGVSNRLELIIFAIREGLLPDPGQHQGNRQNRASEVPE